jgi:hypothetical protein
MGRVDVASNDRFDVWKDLNSGEYEGSNSAGGLDNGCGRNAFANQPKANVSGKR